ncbi:MAG: hypothetical protein SD837_16725 [Candidatus Electrothrix scaldis]|nr:MAG: hypothetical protein SD837_16725 [Candidatus Electrothrix sp. GW3-3]
MDIQRQKKQAKVWKKEFIETFGLTPGGVSKQTGVPLPELGKILKEVARKMHVSPHAVLNQVRQLQMSDSFLLNIIVKYNKRKKE